MLALKRDLTTEARGPKCDGCGDRCERRVGVGFLIVGRRVRARMRFERRAYLRLCVTCHERAAAGAEIGREEDRHA